MSLRIVFFAVVMAAFGLSCFALPAQARHITGTPTPPPTPIPPADPAVTQMARRQFVSWQAGRIDRSEYTADLNSQIDDKKLQVSSTNLGSLGALVNTEYLGPMEFGDLPSGAHAYLYRMICTDGSVYEQLVLDERGKVAGIVFRDTPVPGYANTGADAESNRYSDRLADVGAFAGPGPVCHNRR